MTREQAEEVIKELFRKYGADSILSEEELEAAHEAIKVCGGERSLELIKILKNE